MATQIYVNLPVKNLDRAQRFFKQLGFSFEPKFTNDKGACMVVDEGIYVMLLVEPFFKTFTPHPVSDATRSTEVIVCISRESRDAVDLMVSQARAAGAKTPNPAVDHGSMYQHGFEDLDGHLWEVMHMEQVHVRIGPEDV
jgi:predicted lactoylglutathione lyase